MGIDRDPPSDPVPFFGCMPHVPARTSPERHRTGGRPRKAPPAGPCPTCGDASTEGSPLVCMGCHAVAPEAQARLDAARVTAIAAREPERNLLKRSVAAKLAWTGRSVLLVTERAELVAEYPDLAPAWLDSIGQPPPTNAPEAA